MPGERLMCIWQAVLSKDVFPESGVKRATVQSVVENFAGLPNVTYTERRFQEVFKDQKVAFDKLVYYIDNDLRSPAAALLSVLGSIEDTCWKMCDTFFTSDALNIEELRKMWYIFNRVCLAGTYPPIIAKDDADWLFDKLAKSMDKTWGGKDALPDAGLTFQDMISMLDKMYFSVTSTSRVRESVDEIYNWLVQEVMKVGWLYKRTRKASNWTNWLKRWFIMVPGRLTYYEHPNMKVHKGDVMLEKTTLVETMSDYKGILVKLENRFKISNKPSFEIELCAETPPDKSTWLAQLHQNLDSVKTGLTPITKLLRERDTNATQSAKLLEETQKIAQQAAEPTKAAAAATAPPQRRPAKARTIKEEPLRDSEGIYDNKVAEVQRDKVRAVFMGIDKDGNGRIDQDEFYDFLKTLGADKLDRNDANVLFHGLDKDGNKVICFEEFYDGFLRMVMGETNTEEEAKLRTAFLKADRDGSGAISFREFAEFAYSSRRSIAMDQLIQQFDELDTEGKGEIEFGTFKKFFDSQSLFGDMDVDPTIKTAGDQLEEYLKASYNQADAGNLAKYLRDRWKTFASFRREGVKGEVVMSGGHGMVADVVPGHYNLVDLACFNDLPPITPKHVIVKGVVWNKSQTQGKSGRVYFPASFDGEVPIDIATNEHLAYYGATLASGNQLKVSLLYRHGIQDFTYQNNYLEEYVTAEKALGGAGIEQHEFAHLDCPLEDDSGIFVIAKWAGEGELHITGFKIPTRHTLYLPGGVIHCNDYLKGTWRTMLSDEVEINHVQLTRVHKDGNDERHEKFTFKFV